MITGMFQNIKQIRCEDVDHNHVAQDRIQRRAFMKTVVKSGFE
jgi:hypothetical protein